MNWDDSDIAIERGKWEAKIPPEELARQQKEGVKKAAEIASKEGLKGQELGVELMLNHPALNPAIQPPAPEQ